MNTFKRFFLLLIPLALLGAMVENSWLAVAAVAVLWLGLHLLWQEKVSPVLLFIFVYQWLQASIIVFKANYEGLSIASLEAQNGQLTQAVILSLVGLSFLALGMHQGAGKTHDAYIVRLREQILATPSLYWFKIFVVAWAISIVAPLGSLFVPGLRQVFQALIGLKWAFFWVFTYATFSHVGASRRLWWLVFLAELILSFGGFFSDFKTVLIVAALAALPAGVRLTPGRVIGLFSLVMITLTLGVAWTAVKTDYRAFLNKGENVQVVLVSASERYAYLTNAIGKLDANAMGEAFSNMIDRISYVGFFARVLDQVPARIPHENGAVWGDAVLRPFMPRIFFANKSVIDDSQFTSKFTGENVVSEGDQGTSISIGYIGESYIDFGVYLMMLPIFLLGWTYGKFFRWMCNYRSVRGVIGMGLATSVLLPVCFLETSITKLFGGFVVSVLVAWIFARWGMRYLRKF